MTAAATDLATSAGGRVLRRGLAMIRAELGLAPRLYAIPFGAAAAFALLTVAQSWALGRLIDRAVLPSVRDGEPRWGAVLAGALLLAGVGLLRAASVVARRTGAMAARSMVEITLQRQLLDRYQRQPMAWHRTRSPGELLAHAEADVVTAANVMNPLPFAAGTIVLLVGATALLLRTDPVLATLAVAMAPLVVVISQTLHRRVEDRWNEAQAHAGSVSSVANESFDGAALVKAHGAEDRETARFAATVHAMRDARTTAGRTQAGFNAGMSALPELAMVTVIAVGAWRIQRGALTPGELVAATNLFALLAFPLRLISFTLADLPRSLAGWDRVQGLLAEPVPPPPVRPASLPDGPLDVRIDGLTVAHAPGAPPALEDVHLHVPAGTTLALVGATGAGKSTLLAAVAGLVEATGGRVLLGGADVAALDGDQLAGAVATAFQEPFIFGRSVRGNVLLGTGGPPERAEEAARLAQADDFVRRLPAGYDTVVGERGATLSGGQRQRVALARALARSPRVLLLDDATASVDPATEARITSGLRERLGGATTVVVATRLSTIGMADRVAFLDRGRLLAVGTHEELLAQPGYRAVVEAYS